MGDRVMEVLRTKHPNAQPPSATIIDTYNVRPPELIPVEITDDPVTEVVGRLSGDDGSGGTDSASLQHWLLIFGAASGELRLAVVGFAEWLKNERPLWATYRALMRGRLIALDRQPGVRLDGVEETWGRKMEKCVLHVKGDKAKLS